MTLIVLMFVLVLAAGADGGNWAGAEKTSQGGQAVPRAAASDPPDLEVQAWALVDMESGLYLAGENPDEPLPTASTAIVIPSGTDAAYALAQHAGNGSVENFVGMMNQEASELGLTNTRFEDPAGLDTTGNYSSARDLATLAREALEYPLFAELVGTSDATISTQNREIEIFNTNQLLRSYPPATGVKTGTTPEGDANLVSSAEARDESYIAVVLGAEDSEERFRASEAILEYAFTRYESKALVSQDEVYEEVPLPYRRGEFVELAATENVSAMVDDSSEVERRATTEELPPSASPGEELGEVEVLVDGQSVGSSPLVAQEGYEEASLWDRAWYAVEGLVERAWAWLLG